MAATTFLPQDHQIKLNFTEEVREDSSKTILLAESNYKLNSCNTIKKNSMDASEVYTSCNSPRNTESKSKLNPRSQKWCFDSDSKKSKKRLSSEEFNTSPFKVDSNEKHLMNQLNQKYAWEHFTEYLSEAGSGEMAESEFIQLPSPQNESQSDYEVKFKTEMCRNFQMKGHCKFGDKVDLSLY